MGNYAIVADVRAEGLAVDQASDDRVNALIKQAEQLIERITRQWFYERELTITAGGTGGRNLYLGVPIIDVDELYINGDFANAVPSSEYHVHNGRDYPDDRRNPRIHLKQSHFAIGTANQRIVGKFGFLEPDDATPAAIRYATIRLVIDNAVQMAVSGGAGGSSSEPAGPITGITVDGNTIRYASSGGGAAGGGSTGFKAANAWTGDKRVDQILAAYRSPRIIAASTLPLAEIGGQ